MDKINSGDPEPENECTAWRESITMHWEEWKEEDWDGWRKLAYLIPGCLVFYIFVYLFVVVIFFPVFSERPLMFHVVTLLLFLSYFVGVKILERVDSKQ